MCVDLLRKVPALVLPAPPCAGHPELASWKLVFLPRGRDCRYPTLDRTVNLRCCSIVLPLYIGTSRAFRGLREAPHTYGNTARGGSGARRAEDRRVVAPQALGLDVVCFRQEWPRLGKRAWYDSQAPGQPSRSRRAACTAVYDTAGVAHERRLWHTTDKWLLLGTITHYTHLGASRPLKPGNRFR
jgi:hypothetical protein